MKDLFIVAGFTIKEMVRRKSFIISLIIILAVIVVGIGVFASYSNKSNSDLPTCYGKILIYDEGKILGSKLAEIDEQSIGYELEVSEEKIDSEIIKTQIDEEKITAGMMISEENNSLKIEYVIDSNKGYVTDVPTALINTINQIYKEIKLTNMGIEEETIELISAEPTINIVETGDEEETGNIFVTMAATIILFYAVYFCAFQVSTAITTEKTSRIVETLVTSTKPSIIVLGKTIGIGIVGVFQVIAIIGAVIGSCYAFLDIEMIATMFDISNLSWSIAVYIVIYFILGYLFYALLYALIGSTVSKQEEVNAANTPISIVSVLGFYLAYFTMFDPRSELAGFAAVCPISSAFCMPFRIMMNLATKEEIMFSLIALVVCTAVIARISITIYSLAILNYGNKLKIKDIIKMYKNR